VGTVQIQQKFVLQHLENVLAENHHVRLMIAVKEQTAGQVIQMEPIVS
jgi:hypothetical protein